MLTGPDGADRNTVAAELRLALVRFLLLPRRQTTSPTARWVLCLGCERSALGPRFPGALRWRRGHALRPGPAVTMRALTGLFALNAFVLLVGCGVLFGIRGWRSWGELLRLAGVAYLLGLSALFVVFTFELVVGVPSGAATIVATGLAVLGAGFAVGHVAGRKLPPLRHGPARLPRPSLLAGLWTRATPQASRLSRRRRSTRWGPPTP